MISLRLAVPAVLVASALAACFSYFVTPPPPVTPASQLPEKMLELHMGIPAKVDRPKAQERVNDYLQAARAILKQDPNALASADEPTVTGHIPLPKKRPIPR